MILYLIRHGRQSSTLCNVDVPLNEIGKRQAKLLGERMRKYTLDALYSSDLTRAMETTEIVFAGRRELLAKLQIRKELREMDFGSLTGKPDEEVKAFYQKYYEENRRLFEERKEGALWHPYFIPQTDMGYPEGENGVLVWERVLPLLEEMLQSGKKQIAVVCHGGTIRTILAALFGRDINSRLLFGTSLENCSITQIHYDEEKKGFFLDRFNDYAHLEEQEELLRKSRR